MFKRFLSAAAIVAVMGSAAYAQTTPPAVSTSNAASKTPDAPVAGKNSFTQGEAKKRIESFGYSNVTGLMKDDQSIWRGTASKDGAQVKVALDYQGNVTAQ